MDTLRSERVTLPASRFPEKADVYACDDCKKDVTKYLHLGRAHVRQPIGPEWYWCSCGRTYRTGALEWDSLSVWDQRGWIADLFLAVVLLAIASVPLILGYYAFDMRSVIFFVLMLVSLVPSVVAGRISLELGIDIKEIPASLWRTRVRKRAIQ